MTRFLIAVLIICSTALLTPNQAGAGVSAAVEFSSDEIRIITDWYRDHGQHSQQRGKGKKRDGLPPGIAKNLALGKPLPPGIAKQYLPDDLRGLLPPPRRGYERLVLDGKVLLVEVATRVVHDILVDAVLR